MSLRISTGLLLSLAVSICAVPVAHAVDKHGQICTEALAATAGDIDSETLWAAVLRTQAECHLRGLGGAPKDRARAKSLLEESAELGNEGAIHMLASMRLFESGDPSEQRLGLNQLRRERENGSAFAAGKIGYAYHKGLGVQADDEAALAYYTEAASAGMTRWQLILSRIYEAGLYGQDVDTNLAQYWREYEPKVHVEVYECVMAALYQEDLVFEPDPALAAEFENDCSANRHLALDKYREKYVSE